MSELKAYTYDDMIDGKADIDVKYYTKEDADTAIATLQGANEEKAGRIVELQKQVDELNDKCNMHNFFWEGCGFAKRGFKNTIELSEAFDRLEAENAQLKELCRKQNKAMQEYVDILGERIKDLIDNG